MHVSAINLVPSRSHRIVATPVPRHCAPAGCTSRSRQQSRAVQAMAKAAYEAWVKGDPKKQEHGDCPFCQRALLTLEEKKVPYERNWIDLADKPKWLLEVNEAGSVPVVKDLDTQEWFVDSGKFVDYLEDKHPHPQLGKLADVPDVGGNIFPAFVALIKSTKDEEKKAAALTNALEELNTHLEKSGPYLQGKDISSGDLALAPKLHHLEIAAKHYKGFEIPSQLKAVQKYLSDIRARPSWKATAYSNDVLLAGWKSKVGSG